VNAYEIEILCTHALVGIVVLFQQQADLGRLLRQPFNKLSVNGNTLPWIIAIPRYLRILTYQVQYVWNQWRLP